MRIWVLVAIALVVGAPVAVASTHTGTINRVADGDTVVLNGGERIRLVQIDTPEVYGVRECFGEEASAATKRILRPGTRVRVITDSRLDQKDRYGRTLAYVWKGSSLVNMRLVREGYAAPYFFLGVEGRYARVIFKAAVAARNAGRGFWGRCRRGAVPLRPNLGVSTGSPIAAPTRATRGKSLGSGCNPNYSPCIPNSPTDLNCSDVGKMVRVIGRDVYNLDANGDRYGCESYG